MIDCRSRVARLNEVFFRRMRYARTVPAIPRTDVELHQALTVLHQRRERRDTWRKAFVRSHKVEKRNRKGQMQWRSAA